MKNKYAICIAVYKDRFSQFLTKLNEINKDFDIYIVSQDNDPAKDEYEKYIVADNIKVLTPSVNELSGTCALAAKRDYLIEYTYKNGYSGFINIDDDVNFAAYTIKPEDLRPSGITYKFHKCDINDMLYRMIEVMEEYDAGIVGLTRWGLLGFQKPGKVFVNSSLNPSQFYLVNSKKMIENDLHYDTTGYVVEDFDLTIRTLQKGITCCNVGDYMFNTNNVATVDTSSSIIWNNLDEIFISRIHFYLKYHCPLKIDRHGMLGQTITWKKYFNTTELPPIKDKDIYTLAEKEDIQGIINLLNERKNEKN